MKTPLKIIVATMIMAVAQSGKTQDAAARLNTARANAPGAETNVAGTIEKKQGDLDAGLDMSGDSFFSKVIQFKYFPSERDPFISYEIISPFVTEEELVPMEVNTQQINAAKSAIEGLIRSKVIIGGISTGRLVAGYALGNAGQILKPGKYLVIELDAESQGVIDAAINAVVTAGGAKPEMGLNEGKTGVILQTLRVEETAVVFRSPLSFKNEPSLEITVEYDKLKELEDLFQKQIP